MELSVMCIHKDKFILFQVKNGWIVYNTTKQFEEGHTHLRNKSSALAAINFVLLEKIPRRSSNYYLISLIRISDNPEYVAKVNQLIDTRRSKGKKQDYYNR
jgi:hypothetical protein